MSDMLTTIMLLCIHLGVMLLIFGVAGLTIDYVINDKAGGSLSRDHVRDRGKSLSEFDSALFDCRIAATHHRKPGLLPRHERLVINECFFIFHVCVIFCVERNYSRNAGHSFTGYVFDRA